MALQIKAYKNGDGRGSCCIPSRLRGIISLWIRAYKTAAMKGEMSTTYLSYHRLFDRRKNAQWGRLVLEFVAGTRTVNQSLERLVGQSALVDRMCCSASSRPRFVGTVGSHSEKI